MKIAVIGLGYVGLPLALNLSKYYKVVGFDQDPFLIHKLKKNHKPEKERLTVTSDYLEMKKCNFYIVCVPTPVNIDKTPNLKPLERACESIFDTANENDIVVFESTVYPGLVNSFCKSALPEYIRLGYSPERINPGDEEHTLTKVVKVVSANDERTLNEINEVYSCICKTYRAPSIEVAEAAKVIENTQRDINIALMNELAIIFDRIGIDTTEVLKAASTKWNFHNYKPGLVGGHCIPVDPYYLASASKGFGYNPKIILAGRETNDSMAKFIAEKAVKLYKNAFTATIIGASFKENITDTRNSMSYDIKDELEQYGLHTVICDPFVFQDRLKLDKDIIILAVPHDSIMENFYSLLNAEKNRRALIDVKGVIDQNRINKNIIYWRL